MTGQVGGCGHTVMDSQRGDPIRWPPWSVTEVTGRNLRLMYMDFEEQRKAYRLHGERENAAKTQLAKFTDRLEGRFDPADVKKSVRYMDTIRAAAQLRGLNPDEAEFVWRLASGSTHGKRMRLLCPVHGRAPRVMTGRLFLRTVIRLPELKQRGLAILDRQRRDRRVLWGLTPWFG